MAKPTPALAARLAKLEREDPAAFALLVKDYLARGAVAFRIAGKKRGRDARPGDEILWAEVRAIMDVRGIGHPSACEILAERNAKRAPHVFSKRDVGGVMKAWHPVLDGKTLARYYRAEERRYQSFAPDTKQLYDALRDWAVERERKAQSQHKAPSRNK